MCFSATASFGASAAILVVAAISFRNAKTAGGYLVACMPLCFSIQQAMEGLLWLSLQHPAWQAWRDPATYAYLLFVQVVWPLLIPLMVWAVEKPGPKKMLLALLVVPGLAVAIYFLSCLVSYTVTPLILGRHIRYELHFPGYNKSAGTAAYLMVTLIPPLVSDVRPVRWLGLTLLVSMVVTAWMYKGYFISVWCFFAAVLSVV